MGWGVLYLIVFLCAPKVDELHNSSARDHDVGSLDVSMDDGVGVKVVQRSGDLPSVVGNCTIVQRTKSVCECQKSYSKSLSLDHPLPSFLPHSPFQYTL